MLNDSSVNEENRTVELVWSTGAKGLRSFWGERYFEELSMEPDHVDLSRLNDGTHPLLAVHNDRDLDSVIGVVERAWLDGNEGRALVRFARDEIAERAFQKVKDKILRNISVGYSVDEYTDVSEEGDEIPTFRATRWQPAEISIVPIGFDAAAKIRKDETQTENDVEIITRSNPIMEVQVMDEIEQKRLEQEKLDNAKKEERTRALEIRKAVREAKLPEQMAEDYIERGTPLDEARANIALFAKYAKEQAATQIESQVRVEVGETDADKKRQGFEDALLNRVDGRNFKATEASRLFQGKGLLRMIENVMPRHIGESDANYAKRSMSSSDLPLILANVAEKSAQKRYELAPRTWQRWAKTKTLRNFKEAQQLRAGDFASLLERKESGEYQYGSFGEEKEIAQLKQWGIIHKFTDVMIVNDDLSMIQSVSSETGVASARLENRLVYSALRTNKTMSDGVALYDANHGNLGTAGVFSETTFDEAFTAMRSQTSVDGADPLNIAPKFLICGPELETAAKKFLALVQPAVNSNVNVFSNSVELVVDAQIDDDDYYFAADPNEIDTVVLFHLEGQEAPRISSRVNWSDDSIELKVAHTAAAAPMDHRGLFKNEEA